MNPSNVKPSKGYLVTKKAKVKKETESGFQVEENTDDFLVHAQVVASSSDDYQKGTEVIFHILESQTFRDGSHIFNFIHEDKILGTYASADNSEDGQSESETK